MENFEIIVGVCSILSFLVSLFVAGRVVKISNNFNTSENNRSTSIDGNDNISSGRDTTITK